MSKKIEKFNKIDSYLFGIFVKIYSENSINVSNVFQQNNVI